jgi:hypothetical protein
LAKPIKKGSLKMNTLVKRIAAAALFTSTFAGVVHSATEDIEVEAHFRRGLSFTAVTDFDFTTGTNRIDYLNTPGAGDEIEMDVGGDITYVGTNFTGPATGTPGSISIEGDDVSSVDISCSTTATLEDAAANTVTMNEVQLSMNATTDAFGSSDYTCAGIATTPHSYALTGTDVIRFAGQIDAGAGGTTISSTVFRTDTGAGTEIDLEVIYQ